MRVHFRPKRLHRARGVHLRAHDARARPRPRRGRGASTRRPRVERPAPPHPERPPRARRDDTAHQSRARRRRRPTVRVRVAAQTRARQSRRRIRRRARPIAHRHERARPRALDVIPSVQQRSRPHVTTAERAARAVRAEIHDAQRDAQTPKKCARESSLRRRRRLERGHECALFGFVQDGFVRIVQRGVDDVARRLTASSSHGARQCGDRCGDSLHRADGESRGRLTRSRVDDSIAITRPTKIVRWRRRTRRSIPRVSRRRTRRWVGRRRLARG